MRGRGGGLGMSVLGGRNKKRILKNKKRVRQERGTPNYLRTVNLIAPVDPKTGGSFNFNLQYPTAGFKSLTSRPMKAAGDGGYFRGS